MNAPRILLIGKNGQVGWELRRALAPLGSLKVVGREEADLADADVLTSLVAELKPALVINTAAYTAVDRAESEPELAHQINGVAPGVLAEAARQAGAWMIHFSTDYVFDGTKQGPYFESNPTNPLNVYGQSKLEGELAVRAAGERHLIFRLCWVYATRGRNFLLTMQRLARERDALKVVNDQRGTPTWARAIAEAVAPIAHGLLTSPRWEGAGGTYHLACAGETTWHGFASRIVELMPAEQRRAREVMAIPTTEYPTPAKRPANSVLDCALLQQTFGIRLPDWDAALQLALESC
ncbi:MAG TPA: dTDP-4-dehydrorhamnose reductase [Verrucomicrobiae bacterium]|nr:dTDP-4-dehydrorhamnose reductase [Verrucomicrobiae bacterium]